MTDFGLDDRAVRLMRSVFEKHPRIVEVRVFGSRAKGNFRPESDVDLVMFGDVDRALASLVTSELDELPLPYRFDVEAYPAIGHAPLREHIDRVGKPFFMAERR
jgi:predicted nucleotidyltransferase